jgi:hypothetical protein
MEIIFAELGQGSYFGELSLQANNKAKAHLRDVKEGRCFTSLWAVQNTHMFYLEDKDYEQIQDQLQKKQEIELLTYLRKVPAFKVLRY